MSCHRTIIRLSAVLAVVALAKGCGDGDSPSAPPTPEPARPTTVTVSPATHELTALGATVQLSAEVRDQNARVMVGATVTWTSSASSMATVDASGLVTAAGNGTATITASAGSASGSAVVMVMQSVASVEVSPSVYELTALGQTVQLTAEAFDENGHAVAGTEFSWESSDVAVATVDELGLVTGAGNGEATITASAGEASSSAVVTVMQSVASVEVSPSVYELTALGQTVQLTAEAFDENGHAVAGTEFSWESSDVAVATVDELGLVTGAGNGEATITASAGEASSSAVVTVMQSVASVEVSPSVDELTALGETVQLTAEAFDENGHAVAGAEFSWESSDAAVATVDAGGLVTAVAEGVARITASAGEASGSAVVTVMQPVASVEVSPSVYELTALGETVQLTAEAFDENGHAVAGAEFSWESSDAAVATVDAGGLVTAVAEGVATITASAGEASGSAVVTVMQSVASVEVSPSVYELTALGETVQLTAEAFDENGHAVAGAEFSWESSDAAVATVDAGGLVTAVAEGVATITASAGEASGSAVVTVMQPVASVEVSPSAETIGLGSTLQLTAEAFDENGEAVAGVEFSWESSDAAVAAVDAGGLVTGVAVGVATITASAGSGQGTAKVTVADLDRAALEALYHATDGQNWVNSENWLTDAPLGDWYGVGTDASGGVVSLDLSENDLSGPIPREIGNLPGLRRLFLIYNDLTGQIPSELGNLASLSALWLRDNNLSGIVPAELGDLVGLTELSLQNNALSGPIPQSLLQLDRLRRFFIGGNGSLCVPGTSSFVAWLQGMEHNGASCNAADVAALESLFEATGGKDWIESTGWRGEAAVEEWYGVTADALGRVTELNLTRNELAGQLPRSLGDLVRMTVLRIGGNRLSGRLPLSLAQLSLRELDYADTDLCVPTEASFQTWLGAIPSHEGTGLACAPPSDRDILVALYEATGGSYWVNSSNWLTKAPLQDWHGVAVDGEGRVSHLSLRGNDLRGPIPRELGSLTSLTVLSLARNQLSGPIPPELGNLASLTTLGLGGNALEGPIPPELGNLASLTHLYLWENELSGPIPGELGNLADLTTLSLESNALEGRIPGELGLTSLRRILLPKNKLSGPIPPELGNLSSLSELVLNENRLTGPIPPELGNLTRPRLFWLHDNNLTGPIPPELGNLATLEFLHLDRNDLTGAVPSEIGGMSSLRTLGLTSNPRMEGPLPTELTAIRRLEALLAGDTGLCAGSDPELQAWLNGVYARRIRPCDERSPPLAYLTQAVQSREFPVPLVAGERALLRVFPTARQSTSAGIPAVRARFYINGSETHVVDIAAKSTPIPTEVDESSLSKSANTEIPGNVVQPGLEMVIDVDPNGTLDPALGVAKRIPETGRQEVKVRAMPLFDLTLIPFIWSQTQDRSIVDVIDAMAEDPNNHELLSETRTLLPVGELSVTAHEPVLTSTRNGWTLRDETAAIRVMEGGTGHYMGMMFSPTEVSGVAFNPGRSSFSEPVGWVMAHELGHNLNLDHAPCGTGENYSFPYPDGSIGVWGYDFEHADRLVPPSTQDLMSYCQPQWISDYHFSNALRYRLFDEGSPAAAAIAASRSLLLWGGVSADSVPFLEPAFVVEAALALPDSAGDYVITGRAANGGELFSLSFTMPATADGDGSSSFAFVLPVRPAWEGSLASITLRGPNGSVTLDGDSDLPMAILRNPRTGQVRGILRDLPPATQAARAAAGRTAGPGLEVLISRGIPDAAAWRR